MLALPLVSGPVPVIVGALGFGALAAVVTRRSLSRWRVWPFLIAGPFVAVLLAKRFVPLPADFGTHFPPSFYVWVALPFTSCAMVAGLWGSLPPWRRVVALMSMPCLVLFGALEINAFYDYVPTLADLLGRPLPGQVSMHAL